MGMFDYVEFESGNLNLPLWFDLDLQDLEWQTKDLHNCLYEFVIKDDRLHYRESVGRKLHAVTYTGTIGIHARCGSEDGFLLEYSITFKDGDLVSIQEARKEDLTLPLVPAMEEDNARRSEAMAKSFDWLEEISNKRPWHAKMKSRLNAARYDFAESWRLLIRGLKRLLGFNVW